MSDETKRFTSRKFELLDAAAVDDRLTHSDFVVFYWLLQHLNAETGRCNPSQELIAALSRLSERSVRGSIKKLKMLEYIKAGRKGRGSNFYRFMKLAVDHRRKIDLIRVEVHRKQLKRQQAAGQTPHNVNEINKGVSKMPSDNFHRKHTAGQNPDFASDRQSTAGQEMADRQSTSGHDRQPSSSKHLKRTLEEEKKERIA